MSVSNGARRQCRPVEGQLFIILSTGGSLIAFSFEPRPLDFVSLLQLFGWSVLTLVKGIKFISDAKCIQGTLCICREGDSIAVIKTLPFQHSPHATYFWEV